MKLRLGTSTELEDRLLTIEQNLQTTDRRLPNIDLLLDRNLTCDYRRLYEVITVLHNGSPTVSGSISIH